jgi:hypothetical protein
MKNVFFLLTMIAFVLAGCSPVEPASDLVNTTNPPPASTAILRPTYTKPNPVPTLNSNEIASSVFSDLKVKTQILNSPNGRCSWDRLIASSIGETAVEKYDNLFYVRLSLNCILGDEYEEVNWVLVDEWKPQGLGYSIPAVLGWSADGSKLYFYDEIISDGCAPIDGFQENFRQVNLDSGNITMLFTEMRSGASLSSDTTRLVYYDMQNKDVGVYTFASGEVQHTPLTLPDPPVYWSVGDFTWSPDGQSVLFVMVVGDACNPNGASIQQLDVARGEIKIKWISTVQTASIIEWVDPNRVVITIGQEQHLLDPISGALVD